MPVEFFEISHHRYTGKFFIRTNGLTIGQYQDIIESTFGGQIWIQIFDVKLKLKFDECEISIYETK